MAKSTDNLIGSYSRTKADSRIIARQFLKPGCVSGAAFALRRQKNREGYAAELASLKADLEASGSG